MYTARGGRELYAIGSDPDAAVLYGLKVKRRMLAAFVLSGALAGLAGVLFTARYGTVSSSVGLGIELQAVAAVVIGGVAIFGGSGTVWGAAIGAFLLVTINRALPSLGIEDFWQRAVVGALILGAIVLDRVLARPTGPQARRSEGQLMSTATAAPARTYPDYSQPLWRRLLLTRESAMIALTVAVILYSLVNVQNFDGPLTLKFLLQDIAPILLIALPMTLVIVTGEIDLSVASIMGLSSVLLGVLHQGGMSIPAAALLALLAGLVCGALNGFLVAYVGLPSLAVTIGTLALYRGIAVGLLGTTAVTEFTEKWTDLATGTIGESNWPLIMIPFAVLVVVFVVLLHFTTFGRGIYDIGLNSEAAHFTGVNVARTKLVLFMLSGVVSAFAGIYFTLRFGSARGDNATGYELQVIAAVLLGGVSIFGGRGRLHGVIAGVVLIGVIASALRLESVTVNVTNIIIGLLLIASVIAPSVLSWVAERLSRQAPPAPSEPSGPTEPPTTQHRHPPVSENRKVRT